MRILIPLLALAVSVVVVLAVATREPTPPPTNVADPDPTAVDDSPTEASAPTASSENEAAARDTDATGDTGTTTATTQTPDPTDPGTTVSAAAASETGPETGSPASASAVTLAATYRVRAADAPRDFVIGGLEPDGSFRLEAAFTGYGAGLKKLRLADYAQHITADDRYTLLDALRGSDQPDFRGPSFYTLAARTVTIDGQTLPLNNQAWTADPPTTTDAASSVTYRITLEDQDGNAVGEIVRTWTLPADSYELQLDQRFVNRTDRPLEVRFDQYGVGDLLVDEGAYLGDRRLLVTGYFRPENPPKTNIYTDDATTIRSSIVGDDDPSIWPNRSLKTGSQLAWIASENRYFALIAHRPLPTQPANGADFRPADVPELDALFPRVGVRVAGTPSAPDLVTTLGTAAQTVAPGAALDLSLHVYAGPRKSEVFDEAPYDALGFDKLIRYELGCTWCTFQWLAHLLLGYLKVLHALVFDWGVAIILLVLTVRLLLHPITKRAQTNMMKMSKQMGAIQPEMQKLKEKYKDNPQKMNAEVMKLYREKGVNPAGFLGCAPMLLQTPIWIALYAMLYYAIELRHQPAFYGVFQSLTGGNWKFLADLSVADHFIKFPGDGFKLNLIFVHPTFAAINILPILMAVTFYFNMKFTTPPPQTDEQRQQQRIMKIMPFIFPVFLYSAPSGLTLYICASTAAGIVDSYLVRKHVREQEEAGTLFAKKEVKEGSLRWKMQQRIKLASEMAQARMEEQQRAQQGRKQVDNTAGNKNYKNRKKK